MLNYLKKCKLSNISFIVLTTLGSCLFNITYADTLNEAIHHSLLINPEAIFSANNGAANLFSEQSKTPHQNKLDTLLKGLLLTQAEVAHTIAPLKAHDLSLQVVNDFLSVVYQEKRLDLARANLRFYRMIYLDNPSQKSLEKILTPRLAEAEAEVLKSQNLLHQSQKQYAKTVGKWPNKLQAPFAPENKDLPQSVGQAIEQGLDNYLYVLSSQDEAYDKSDYDDLGRLDYNKNHKDHLLKKQSMLEFSKSIRASWDEWTEAGIKANTLKKEVAELSLLRDNQLASFKKDGTLVRALLDAEKALYKKQLSYNRNEFKEQAARFCILDSTGNLHAFINSSSIETVENKPSTTSLEILADLDKISLPYPDYKPQFDSDIPNTMSANEEPSVGALNGTASIARSPCYVSAGTFKNKANAVALVNRLNSLGFIAFMKTEEKGSSVFIGPYDYPRHASIGMKRLKDIAHVQGSLIMTSSIG